jgi:hypothetical protein
LSEKILSDREEKEKKLLNSFAESHSRITTKIPADDRPLPTLGPEEVTKKPPSVASFVRPRRKFEIGAKIEKGPIAVVPDAVADVESVKDDLNEVEVVANSTDAAFVTPTTTTAAATTEPESTSGSSSTLILPTPRPLPKDLKLPFGKKGFKPTLLSFTIEKKPSLKNDSQVVENGSSSTSEATTSPSLAEVTPGPDQDNDNSKISSLKRKFQFGRKAFGKLVGPKGPEVNSSQPPSSSKSSTTSSTPDPNIPAPDVLLTSPDFSLKVF